MTSVKVFKPEIVELLAQVERKFGKEIVTPTDYFVLAERLKDVKQAVSVATLKRL